MRILYIFPHPDDESFGPAPAISRQQRQGHEIHLLTLTRGEATKERFKLGVSRQEMGNIRYQEMQAVAKVLQLRELTVLDLPDGQFKHMDPRDIEAVVEEHIGRIKPHVVVTYAVHGISGFHDHLVIHPAVKRVYLKLREKKAEYPKRLAFFTVSEAMVNGHQGIHRLNHSKDEEIDCIENADEIDMQRFHQALDCYETYQEVIRKSQVRELVTSKVSFEFFQESFDPPLNGICEGLLDD